MKKLICPIAGLWAGSILGGSLILAPAKFVVPELPLSLALRVGRAQFEWLTLLEWGLVAGLILFVALSYRDLRYSRALLCALGLAVAVFALQRFAVFPLLTQRTEAVLSGAILGPSYLHGLYAGLDVLKVIALTLGTIIGIRAQT